MHEAHYYDKRPENVIACHLCPKECVIHDGKAGFCGIRMNRGGTLVAEMYGRVAAVNLDPIEKKPLYHFHPGTSILSVGTLGCNFRCRWCQNYHLIEHQVPTQTLAPENLIRLALQHRSPSIAYTYNEPFIWLEYVLDCSKLARQQGLKNVLVTNGFVNPKPLEDVLPFIDAMNIDLKSSRPENYQKYSQGKLEPVLHTIRRSSQVCHIEITTLLVTGVNDSDEDIQGVIDFVASVNPDMPLHFSRYHPQYRFDAPATSMETLERAYEAAKKKLNYVYLGNVRGEGSDTLCPKCQAVLIERYGYQTTIANLCGRQCGKCGSAVAVVV